MILVLRKKNLPVGGGDSEQFLPISNRYSKSYYHFLLTNKFSGRVLGAKNFNTSQSQIWKSRQSTSVNPPISVKF